MTTQDDCVFCKILSGQLPASFVYRDEVCAAFLDVQPDTPGHTLVVPIQHAAHLADLDSATFAHMSQVAQRVAAALRVSGLKCDGVNLFLADGEIAGQEVFHVHLHVLPRFPRDGFVIKFGPDYGRLSPRPQLDDWAENIKANLK